MGAAGMPKAPKVFKKQHGHSHAWFLLLGLFGASLLLTGRQIIPVHIGSLNLEQLQSRVPRVLSSSLFNPLPTASTLSSSSGNGGAQEHRGSSALCPVHASISSKPCGNPGTTEQVCRALNCCWQLLGPGQAACRMPQRAAGWETYQVVSSSVQDAETQLKLALVQPQLQRYGTDFPRLQVQVQHETPSRLHVKISPPGAKRWEVPESLLPRPGPERFDAADALYRVLLPEEGEPFSLVVASSSAAGADRQQPSPPVFNTTGSSLVFKDQYLEMSTSLPQSASLYGLGQRVASDGALQLPRDGSKLVLWNYDIPAATPDTNLYGSHPFYLQVNADGSSHGVLLLNSNALEVTLHQKRLKFRALGGLLDLYFFLGPGPEAVIRQYQAVVGRPAMPPLWSLGFHSCRWGYRTLGLLKEAVGGYRDAGIPLDAVWTDIDYMDRFRDFTFDEQRFPVQPLRKFIDSLHAAGQRWVPIIDSGIPVAADDAAYQSGIAAGVFVRDVTGQPYTGQVWPGATHYPDFLSLNTTWPWWQRHIQQMHKQVPFDGLWIDMNEPSNFCSGEVCKLHKDNKLHALMASDRAAAAAAAAAGAGAAKHKARRPLQADGNAPAAAAAAAMVDEDSLQREAPAGDEDELPAALSADELPTASADADDSDGSGGSGPAPAAVTASHDASHGYLASEHSIMRQLTTCHLECQQPAADNSLAHPPYAIHAGISSAARSRSLKSRPLGTKTLPMTATGLDGARHYDTHNLYGLSQAAATHAALAATLKKRPFVLTRSTFAGSGRFSAHWGGDNAATWRDLRWSVGQLLSANMAGLAMSGSDICGFIGNTTEELCARWASAGAFYTFSRAHNSLRSAPQELYRWPSVAAAARRALGMRYRLLPFLYSSFYQAHTLGGTVARPLLFEFPSDGAARKVNDQWLLSSSLLVSPVVHQGRSQRTAYFPAGCWYDLWAVQPSSSSSSSNTPGQQQGPAVVHGPGRVTLQAPVGDIPLHVRGGSIIPMQQQGNTTAQVWASPLSLLVAIEPHRHGHQHQQHTSAGGDADASQQQQGQQQHKQRRLRSSSSSRQPLAAGDDSAADAAAPRTAPEQCSALLLQDPAAAAASRSWQQRAATGMPLVACGVLYVDRGESLEVPDRGPGSSLLLYFAAGAAGNLSSGWLQAVPAPAAVAVAGGDAGGVGGVAPRLHEVLVMGLDLAKSREDPRQQQQAPHAIEDEPTADDEQQMQLLLRRLQAADPADSRVHPASGAAARTPFLAAAAAAAAGAGGGPSAVKRSRLLLDQAAGKGGKQPSSKNPEEGSKPAGKPKPGPGEAAAAAVAAAAKKDARAAPKPAAAPASSSSKTKQKQAKDQLYYYYEHPDASPAAAAAAAAGSDKGGSNTAAAATGRHSAPGIEFYYEDPDSHASTTTGSSSSPAAAASQPAAAAAADAKPQQEQTQQAQPAQQDKAGKKPAPKATADQQQQTAGAGTDAAEKPAGATDKPAAHQPADAASKPAGAAHVQPAHDAAADNKATAVEDEDDKDGAAAAAAGDDDVDADNEDAAAAVAGGVAGAAAAAAAAAAEDASGGTAGGGTAAAAAAFTSDFSYSSAAAPDYDEASGGSTADGATAGAGPAGLAAASPGAGAAPAGGGASTAQPAPAPSPAEQADSAAGKQDDGYSEADYYGLAAVKAKRRAEKKKRWGKHGKMQDGQDNHGGQDGQQQQQGGGSSSDQDAQQQQGGGGGGGGGGSGGGGGGGGGGESYDAYLQEYYDTMHDVTLAAGGNVTDDGGDAAAGRPGGNEEDAAAAAGGAVVDDDGIATAVGDAASGTAGLAGGGGDARTGAEAAARPWPGSADGDDGIVVAAAPAVAARQGGSADAAVAADGSGSSDKRQEQQGGRVFAATLDGRAIAGEASVVYEPASQVLRLRGLQAADLSKGFVIEWHELAAVVSTG